MKDPLEKFKADMRKKYQMAVRDLAQEVAFEIEKAYESVVQRFYNDYPNPSSYKRTYSTYLGSSAYDSPFEYGVQKFGDSYFSGMQVSASNIPGNPYKANKGWVFDRTFYEGIHGYHRNEAIKANATKKKGDVYMSVKHAPRRMNPPPRKLMDKEYKHIVQKKNIDRIFAAAMEKYFP